MAVHIRVLGFRKLDSVQQEQNKWTAILNRLKLDLQFLEEPSKDFNSENWKLVISENKKIYEYQLGPNREIELHFENENFVEFMGADSWNWFDFVDMKNIDNTSGWRKIFANLAREYGITELHYFSEWFFDPDDIRSGDISFQALKNQIDSNLDLKRDEIWGMESTQYFVEKIS